MRHAITISIFLLLAGFASTSAKAEMRELSQSELRENVQMGVSMSLDKILGVVAERVPGEVVDVRAFQDGAIYYRILIKQPNGKLGAVIMDAGTAAFVSGKSAAAHEVMAAAKSNGGTDTRHANSRSSRDGDSRGGGNGGRGSGDRGSGGAGKR